jgi:hypothetical protein
MGFSHAWGRELTRPSVGLGRGDVYLVSFLELTLSRE